MAFALAAISRTKVFCIGDLPPDTEFKQRNLSLSPLPADPRELIWGRALVVRVEAGKSIDTDSISKVLDHGYMVLVVAEDDSLQKKAIEALSAKDLAASVIPRTDPEWWDVAERIARWDCQQGEGDVELNGDVPTAKAFLLRRAFSDCKSLLLEKIGGGLSGAEVFRIHAIFKDSLAGPRPLPFFAKFDKVDRIKRELDKYTIYVDRYIPFYLRPHLDHSRCITTSENGILVGDFVEHSEPLKVVLASNRGRQAINSLFEESLRSWRLQAFQTPVTVGNVSKAIYTFDIGRFPASRVANAKALGARCDPKELVDRLENATAIGFRNGPIHGDLNCGNVQVRNGDAILIDFYTTKSGPIVADPASLEVDVVFSYEFRNDVDAWKSIVDRLYGTAALSRVPDPPIEPTSREWLWESVRQIRMHGLTPTPAQSEYVHAVATYLLRRASYPTNDAKDEERRTYAYYIADQIIRSI